MKKQLFTLLTLLVMCVTGAWAGDIYKLQLNGANVEYVNGTETTGDIMTFFSYNSSKHNFNTKFNGCTYDGVSYTSGLKMEGATNVSWTSTSTATVTIVESTWSEHTIKFDGSELAIKDAVAGTGCRIFTISDVKAGNHSVTRGSGENGIFAITVEYTGSDPSDTSSPSITTDLNDATPYNASVGSPLALTIAAEHYTGFQWYTCDSEGNSAEAVSGATSATYNYTPTAADATASPKYFKCIVTNSNATGTKTATSKIATVNVTASTDASAKSVKVVANGTYEATAEGNAYSATIGGTTSATVTITPNDGTAIVSSGSTVGSAGVAINVSATAGTQLSFSITAGDGETTENYTLDITKASDKVATNNAYYLSEDEKIYGGQRVIGDYITMTYSDATNGTFAKAVSDSYIKDHDANYVASTAGNGQNGSASGISGTWYKFSPSISGTLTVGSIINDDKQLYIYKDDKNTKITEGVTYWAYGEATLNSNLKANGKVMGLITLNVEGNHHYYFSVGGSKMGFYGFEFTPTVSKTISDAGWATYCSPYALDFSNTGTTVYTAARNTTTNNISLSEVSGGKVPANTGVILYKNGGGDINPAVIASANPIGNNNELVGIVEDTPVAYGPSNGKYNYIMEWDGDNNKPMFSMAAANGAILRANKAYLSTAYNVETGTARALAVASDAIETTGINNVQNSGIKAQGYYNLNGQRVSSPTKGLYIVNGRKVVVK